MKIIIEQLESGWNVIQGDKYSDQLGYEEMLGLISALTMPEKRHWLSWMKTEEQHAAIRAIHEPVVDLLTNERREDMLTGALEGGSNYWYFLPDTTAADKYRHDKHNDREPLVTVMMRAVIAGESFPIHDKESITNEVEGDSGELLGMFNLESIRKGEQLMQENAPFHWADIIEETDDATTADIWFQYCVMGKSIYG